MRSSGAGDFCVKNGATRANASQCDHRSSTRRSANTLGTAEKPITAEQVRKIVRDELARVR